MVLAPMRSGIRVTTGAEFARRDAQPSPVQLDALEPKARALFPLGEGIDEPWLVARPSLPDLRPVICALPRLPKIFANFGHQHHGFTLSPVTGALAADLALGRPPLCDPAPFAATRF